MNGSVIVDTNVIIQFFNGDEGIRRRLRAVDLYIPAVVIGELIYGAAKSGNREKNLKRIDELVSKSAVLNIELRTARAFGNLKQQLRSKGRPIPDNDLWIAALAIDRQFTLITRDAHFKNIDNLKVEFWI
jgi:tRNA(fMet)-specific endonuclease VapC